MYSRASIDSKTQRPAKELGQSVGGSVSFGGR